MEMNFEILQNDSDENFDYELELKIGDTMKDDEGIWFFEDGEWWLE